MCHWQCIIKNVGGNNNYITDLTFLYPPCAAFSGVNALQEKNNSAKSTANKTMRQKSKCFVMGLDFT